MSTTQYQLIANGIVPRAGKVPSDIDALNSLVTFGFCPVKSAERRARADYLGAMIDNTIAEEMPIK